jgi:hypothetical protein
MPEFSLSHRPCRRSTAKTVLTGAGMILAPALLVAGCGTAGSPQATALRASAPQASAPRAAVPVRAFVPPPASLPPHAVTPPHTSPAAPAQASEAVQPVRAPSRQPAQLPVTATHRRLPAATTYVSLPAAPRDPHPFRREKGAVLHPTARRVIYTRPGGAPLAVLPVTELKNPTWVPIIGSRPGWDQVLLPTRPNQSTGWVRLGHGLRFGYSPYRIVINLARYRMTVFRRHHKLGSWTVAVGARDTTTPTGRTFLLASLAPRPAIYTPLILPLGTHSRSLSTFGGGPGTVALHGWPDAAVFGHAASHGCVRVPARALRILSGIPLGSSVLITN